jgi:uncharacterized protein (TIGR03089 family)
MADLLDSALARDGARPFMTWYDDRVGERLELSVATFATWVAKTAALLSDGLGVAPSEVVRVELPRHWLRSVWTVATWRAGCTLAIGTDMPAAVHVGGPDVVPGRGGETVAVSLLPMAAPPPPGQLPPTVLDYAREASAYPDRFPAVPWPSQAAALVAGKQAWEAAALAEAAAALADRWSAGPGSRLLVAEPLDTVEDVLAASLVPLLLDGSVVLCAPPGDAATSRAEAERVTATATRGTS